MDFGGAAALFLYRFITKMLQLKTIKQTNNQTNNFRKYVNKDICMSSNPFPVPKAGWTQQVHLILAIWICKQASIATSTLT